MSSYDFLEAQRFLEDIFPQQIVSSNVVYGNSIDDLGQAQDLLLDFYEPEGDTANQRPLLIWVHGGSFTGGSKNDFTLSVFSDYLLPKGYTTAHVSYRLSSQNVLSGNDAVVDTLALYKAAHNGVHDVRAAVRFFKRYANDYRIDPERIYVAGISAGAIIAVELGYLNKLEELYPDVQPRSIEGESGNPGFDSQVAGVVSLCGTSVFPTIIEGPTDPALFMAHDFRDPIVPYANARATFDQAVAVGTLAHGNFYDTSLHCSWSIPLLGFANLIDVQNQLKTFLHNRVTTSLEEQFETYSWLTYPNPFLSSFTLESNESVQGHYRVLDLLGKEVLFGRLENGRTRIDETNHLSSGFYILNVYTQNGLVKTLPIVKTR